MNPNILLIDDDKTLLEGTVELLEMYDFDIITTQTAEIGLHLTHQVQFDLIICDYQLSGMTGLEFARKLKANPDTKYIPVLLLTGYRRSQIRNMPADIEIMMKPFEIPAFIATIKGLLKSNNAQSFHISGTNS